MRVDLQQILFEGFNQAGGGYDDDDKKCDCAWISRQHSAYKKWMSFHFSPKAQLDCSISAILERLEKTNDPVPLQDQCSYKWHFEPRHRESRSYKLREIRGAKGLSIEQVQELEKQ
jgi:hypothetical protein